MFASALLLVRPRHFGYNPENADNTFAMPGDDAVLEQALAEFDAVVEGLKALGLAITVLRDSSRSPDAIFPNNWFSTHRDGRLVYYPMKAPSRRREVCRDFAEYLRQSDFVVRQTLDWSGLAEAGLFLEGTGSLVLDHGRRVAYAALSERTDASLVARWAEILGYTTFCFEPCLLPGADGRLYPVYHTNVLLAQGQNFMLWAPEGFARSEAAQELRQRLADSEQFSLELSLEQVRAFAGNVLQVETPRGPCLLMSQTAKEALLPSQIAQLERFTTLKAFAIPTIERVGGGSLRCMLAELFLPKIESLLA
ncbi:MAG: amidinotransferase [Candidatus Sericytochromatia bacterium]|nr:amidinotransferase [Candidatus Sericytochromatia bacterium]